MEFIFVLIVVTAIAVATKQKAAAQKAAAPATPAPAPALPMLESDLPPALALAGPEVELAEMPAPPAVPTLDLAFAGFEDTVTTSGHRWFRPVLRMEPVVQAPRTTLAPFGVFERILIGMRVPFGRGPAGLVFLSPKAPREPMAVRVQSRKVLRGIQFLRRSLHNALPQ